MTAHPARTPAALGQHIAELHAEAGGVMVLEVVGQADMPAILAAALDGDAEARLVCSMVTEGLAAIQDAPAGTPMLCATCDEALHGRAFTFALALPVGDNPHRGLCMAVCPGCGPNREAARARALQAVRSIWPGARPFTLHPGGAA